MTASTPPHVPDGALVCAVGPAGAGKSTLFRDLPRSSVICLDELRERLADDAGDQSTTPQAVQLQNLILATRLERGLTTYLDATNVQPHVRHQLLERARAHGRPVIALVFLTDLETCLARNATRARGRRVPPETVARMHQQTAAALDTLLDEGFTAVHTVVTHQA